MGRLKPMRLFGYTSELTCLQRAAKHYTGWTKP